MKRLLASLGFLWACGWCPAMGQAEGIFADFETSKGDFTVRLEPERAPRAVASFVGLATGELGWADPAGNVWSGRPFYDGTIFHRVVKIVSSNEGAIWTNGIAIQGGGAPSFSVNTNTGGVTTNFANAGYRMLDATTNGLAHSNGVISMANSGPNTDGSQFFLTATNVPGWDGGYTVFGHVTTGMDVVAAIAAVEVRGEEERPAQDVVLNRVSIRREGAAAAAFNIASQGVPVVESAPMSMTPSGTNMALRVELAEQSETLFRESTDLRTWENTDWGFWTNAGAVSSGQIAKADLGGLYFFHVMRIRYLVPITAPATHRSRVYTFVWSTNPPGMYEAHFAANEMTPGVFQELNGGAYTNGQLLSAWESWAQDAYSARLISLDHRNYMNYYSLGFDPGAVTNRFTCRRVNQYTGQSVTFSGTFTVR